MSIYTFEPLTMYILLFSEEYIISTYADSMSALEMAIFLALILAYSRYSIHIY